MKEWPIYPGIFYFYFFAKESEFARELARNVFHYFVLVQKKATVATKKGANDFVVEELYSLSLRIMTPKRLNS